MKYIILTLLLFIIQSIRAQSVSGKVTDIGSDPLIGATVQVLDSENGTVTDVNGHFKLGNVSQNDILLISYVGYISDTLRANTSSLMTIQLSENTSELGEVVVQSSTTFMDMKEPAHKEVITEKELLKAACCNLSESFETNASVDVSFADAVTGTKTIQMLGLDGKYTLINRENIPNIRGLSSRNGLTYIPGTWIQSIDVGKGAGTVINGYESMTGQINLEFKKPNYSEKLYLNSYVNSFGRTELNANTAYKINENWSGALLTHGSYYGNEVDRNNDGFMDLPKSKQINVLNRYKFQGERMESQVGIHLLADEKAGGQRGFAFGGDATTSTLYGYSNIAQKAEVFGKVGLLFPEAPYKGWGFLYSATYQEQNSHFGRRAYVGKEKTIYANLIHQNILGNTFHQIKTGASFMIDDYDESFADSTFARTEIVPGTFFEYNYLPNDKLTLVAGGRVDFHNLYGTYFSPRFHFRYEVMHEGVLRLSAGKGFRTSNIIPENNQAFISSRALVVEEELKPEESWNMGGSFSKEIHVGNQKLNIVTDYFYTHFMNQVVIDLDQNPRLVRFYNLEGDSYAHSFQFETKATITPRFSAKAAYKYYDVKSTINGELRPLPYVAKHRGFWNISYSSKYDIWKADATFQWFGRKRLPNTSDKPTEFQQPNYSPDFTSLNAQITKAFRWGSIYLGGENILDFRQKEPIIDSSNPFSENFDGSLVWGPVAGRIVYLGARFKIE